MDCVIVTNNPKCAARYQGVYTLIYRPQWTYLEVLYQARDLVHRGWSLLIHPMAGSLKPNQTPYRSVALGAETLEDKKPWEDVTLIESSISSCEKFLRDRALPHWPGDICLDFQTLDLSHIESALANPICTRR